MCQLHVGHGLFVLCYLSKPSAYLSGPILSACLSGAVNSTELLASLSVAILSACKSV